MKKVIVALFAMVGFGTAFAQSSVTIYGIIDAAYSGKNLKGNPATATNTNTTNSFISSGETPSRLGFKGSEDLGGGTSAFFTVETGLSPTSSSISAVNNRQSFVGLKQNGIGQASIGTQYTPMFQSVFSNDPGGANNNIGSVIYPPTGTDGGQASADAAFTLRVNNSIVAESAEFYGAKVRAMYSMNNKNSTQTASTTGGTADTSAWGIGADYTWNKLFLTGAYQSLKNVNDSVTTSSVSTTATGTVGSTGITYVPSFTVTNGTDNQAYLGGNYDFGILKAYLGWTDRKVTSNLDSSQSLSRSAQQIGVRGYVTTRIESWVQAGNGRYSAFGSNQGTANFTGYQVGSNYWLSKRTNLYGIFGSTQTSSTSTSSAVSGNQYSLGMRHTF